MDTAREEGGRLTSFIFSIRIWNTGIYDLPSSPKESRSSLGTRREITEEDRKTHSKNVEGCRIGGTVEPPRPVIISSSPKIPGNFRRLYRMYPDFSGFNNSRGRAERLSLEGRVPRPPWEGKNLPIMEQQRERWVHCERRSLGGAGCRQRSRVGVGRVGVLDATTTRGRIAIVDEASPEDVGVWEDRASLVDIKPEVKHREAKKEGRRERSERDWFRCPLAFLIPSDPAIVGRSVAPPVFFLLPHPPSILSDPPSLVFLPLFSGSDLVGSLAEEDESEAEAPAAAAGADAAGDAPAAAAALPLRGVGRCHVSGGSPSGFLS
ncbi:hypothetical protein GW17_00045429 [Ensete ventricosum]|nr:hypothetical protein GW17_00045429 [Ensete ventricosum]